MERTTQELMDALLSKRDVEDYLRENAGELLSQTLASCLESLLSRHGLKTGAVIEAAGKTLHLKLHVMDSDSYQVLTDRTVEVKLA